MRSESRDSLAETTCTKLLPLWAAIAAIIYNLAIFGGSYEFRSERDDRLPRNGDARGDVRCASVWVTDHAACVINALNAR